MNSLDDLFAYVEEGLQCNGSPLSDPSNASQRRSAENPGGVRATSEGDVEGAPKLRSIDSSEAGLPLSDNTSPVDAIPEIGPKEDPTAQSVNFSDQDLNSGIYGGDGCELEMLVATIASGDGEGAMGLPIPSNLALFDPKHENSQVTAPFNNHDNKSFTVSNLWNVIERSPEDSEKTCLQQRHTLDISFEKSEYEPGFNAEADLFSEEMDLDLIGFVDEAFRNADEVSGMDKLPSSRDSLTLKVPALALFQSKNRICSQPKDEVISNTLKKLRLNPAWSMEGLEEEKKMNWLPFKPSRKIHLEETISDGSERLSNLISPPKDVSQSSQLLFKEPGLRILDSSECDEAELEENGDLAKFMSQQISQQVALKIPQKRPAIDQLLAELPKKRSLRCTKGDTYTTEITTGHSRGALGGAFSASNALETFLDLRGTKFKRTTLPPGRPSVDEIEGDPILTQTQEDVATKASHSQQQYSGSPGHSAFTIQVPSTPMQTNVYKQQDFNVPDPLPLSWRRSIMVETSMLKTHRSLLASLEQRGGDKLDIIYREMDFGPRHLRTKLELPDVILNPASCLIFTNLQAISQKSLPGQKPTSSDNKVRRKVQALAQEYDFVFIVATIPRILGGNFPQSHLDVMSTFTGYCASFKWTSVTPTWVVPEKPPPNTEEEIHAWTWSLISQQAFPTSKEPTLIELIHDETSLEHFLRKVGMNPMASQVVLGMLHKDPCAHNDPADESWGLSRLVCMSADERVRRFEKFIGKRSVERMNAVLESEWNQEKCLKKGQQSRVSTSVV